MKNPEQTYYKIKYEESLRTIWHLIKLLNCLFIIHDSEQLYKITNSTNSAEEFIITFICSSDSAEILWPSDQPFDNGAVEGIQVKLFSILNTWHRT